jgi:hypothetical protein
LTRKLIHTAIALSLIILFSSFNFSDSKYSNSLIIQFVAVNGYGNNLYLDNISFGPRPGYDIAITSINNIPKDTTYLYSYYTYKITPKVNVTNLGTTAITNDTIYMEVKSLGYSSKDTIGALLPGQTIELAFDSLSIVPGTKYDIVVYAAPLASDSTYSNDTLKQTSVFLPGAYRNVLVEEFTSMTSASCGNNNPSLDSYLDSNFQFLCAVKYHLGFPTPGIDSLYLEDTLYQKQRANYYYTYAVPTTFLDGKLRLPLPYSVDSNLTIPFDIRYFTGTPLSMDVKDTLIAGDTIQATINVNLLYTLASKNLRLRIYAIERHKFYENSPGTNGEKNFYDIFKRAYPDSSGILLSNIAGNYQYTYKYFLEPNWQDSLIYTLAFVQDDNTKEVLNCGKSRSTLFYRHRFTDNTEKTGSNKADVSKNIPNIYKKNIIKNRDTSITGNFNFEGFEGPFPPPGWTILNPDVGFTFEKLNGYNGPRFGGVNCIKIPFYDYPNAGQKDTLLSMTFTDVSATDSLRFDYAYAQYLSGYIDSLIVNLSTDGGMTFINIFSEGGYPLSTSQATTLSFAPVSSTQWKTFSYPMSAVFPLNPGTRIPETYRIYQNYPNPFNPSTFIKFDLSRNVIVTIKIYDLLGREIMTLINEKVEAGSHTIEFKPTNLASGIYFYKFTAGDFSEVKKMVFIK